MTYLEPATQDTLEKSLFFSANVSLFLAQLQKNVIKALKKKFFYY